MKKDIILSLSFVNLKNLYITMFYYNIILYILDWVNVELSTSMVVKKLLQVLLLFSILYLGYIYISHKTDILVADRYFKVATQMKQQIQVLIDEKQSAILELSLAMAENHSVKKALLTNDATNIHLDKFSLRLRANTNLKNIWFQIVRADGTSLYRSFSDKKDDDLLNARVDIVKIIKKPQIITSISVGKFSITLKAMIPIYEQENFIGVVETIAQFNSIVLKMNTHKYKTIVFIDKAYKEQLVFGDKDKFLEDYYIASGDENVDFLNYIKRKTAEHVIHYNQNYHVCEEINSIITVHTLYDEITHKPMAYFVMAHNIEDIELEDINQVRYNLFLILGGLLFIIFSIFIYFYLQSKKELIKKLNNKLEDTVETKTKELTYLAHYDALTGLINRHLFSEIVQHSIEVGKRDKSCFSILFLDLDRFKDINDTYGHSAGDELLKSVAKRLKSCVRSEDSVSRLGGDEFIILIKNIPDNNLVTLLEKIIAEIQQPIVFENNVFNVTFSIGISSFPKDGTDSEVLISNADMAMYKAKELGRNTFAFYDKKMGDYMLERLKLESNIKIALEKNQFEAFYQPQVDSITNKIIGAEALIRWNSPELGFIAPDKFIPIAEETQLIIDIDTWMMRQTMKQLIEFQKEGIEIGKLSLNISARQLESKDIAHHLKMILNETHFDPTRLELEITERQMMKDPEASIVILNKIKEMGIGIAVDDFGTGHSSLAYIKRLPIDKLKIDKSFVDELPNNKEDIAIIRSIISIAKNLQIDIIAEGVESAIQRDFLRDEGCKMIQGYFYSKPLNADDYKKFLQKNTLK
jgi:diguanylate cyclase (GGDEF)-like protein